MKNSLLIIFLLLNIIGIAQEEMLEIDGAIQIANSTDPTPDNGTIRYNNTTNDFEGYSNTQWKSFTNKSGSTGILYDIDDNKYLIVQIGSQTWMKENLRTSRYKDGTPIARVTDNTVWGAGDNTGKFSWYNNNQNVYDAPYGKLYNWYAVDDSRGLCPEGWHVPTNTEWLTLKNFLDPSIAGGQMKIPETVMWNGPNTGATNESGFTAVASGFRSTNGSFSSIGNSAFIWSSLEDSDSHAWFRILSNSHSSFLNANLDKRLGCTVRCLKD